MINLHKKLDWRLNNLRIAQKRIKKKIQEVNEIIKLRQENELSLRDIGKRLGMSHQKVDNIIKQFGIYDPTKTKNIKKI
jgi:DNA-directed RNA polymerase specialized sigma subunit